MSTIWQATLFAVVGTLIVVLFMGPGLFTSTTDPLVVLLWRKIRKRLGRRPGP